MDWICCPICTELQLSFNVVNHGGPTYSEYHMRGSAGVFLHEARTTQWQCCLPHLQMIELRVK